MKNLAFVAMFGGAFGLLVGCGGGDDTSDVDSGGCIINCVDAGVVGPDAMVNTACNPVAQTGCQVGEKCTYLVESAAPLLARTACTPDGSVPTGGQCTEGEPGPTTGYDDCLAGNLCTGGECLEICSQIPDTCAAGEACVPYSNTWTDITDTTVGMCNPTCDVLMQDCPQIGGHEFGDGCYMSLNTGRSTCAQAFPDDAEATAPGVQGEECNFLNTCAVGYGCTQPNVPMNAAFNVCAFFCDWEATGGPSCADGPGPSYTCVSILNFYSDTPLVPPPVGFCIDCEVWAGAPGCPMP